MIDLADNKWIAQLLFDLPRSINLILFFPLGEDNA